MPIKLSNFVDVNFKTSNNISLIGSYNTVVVISKLAVNDDKSYQTLSEYIEDYPETNPDLYGVGETFFNAGGNILRIIKRGVDETVPDVLSRIDSNFIFFAVADTLTSSEIEIIATALDNLEAPDKKILLATDQSTDAKDSGASSTLASTLSTYNHVALKYSTNNKYASLYIGAYFSNIDLDRVDNVKDYNFTAESLEAEGVTQTEYETLISRNYNFTDTIDGKTLNFGGNLTNGNAIDLEFGLIAIEKDCVRSMINFLLQKPYMTDSAMGSMQNYLSSIMSRYINNGLLTENKVYTGESETVSKNGNTYDLIQKNDILVKGYKIYILPISSLTDSEKALHIAPSVYIYATISGSIRKVVIEGVVE